MDCFEVLSQEMTTGRIVGEFADTQTREIKT